MSPAAGLITFGIASIRCEGSRHSNATVLHFPEKPHAFERAERLAEEAGANET
jgi:hypothetical protein